MSEEESFVAGTLHHKNEDFEYQIPSINGLGLPPFPKFIGDDAKMTKLIQGIQNMETRSDDVIIAAYPKCGTHWVWEILNMLAQGKANYQCNIKETMMIEAESRISQLDNRGPPRILNTHLPYRWFPKSFIKNGGKIVHLIRNPKDMYVSYFHHASSSGVLGGKTKDMTWSQFFDNYVLGKVQLYGTWFSYERQMSKAKKENSNIITIHYEKLKSNPTNEMYRIARFLDVKVTKDLVSEIADKCNFQNLKKADKEIKKFSPDLREALQEAIKQNPDLKFPDMYRKGIVGDWKNHFTVAQNEIFNKLFEKEMMDTDIEVFYDMPKQK